MKIRNSGVRLQVKRARTRPQESEQARQEGAFSWERRIASSENQSAVERGIKASRRSSKERLARIEELRVQVTTGTYLVDSHALAEKMLSMDQEPIWDSPAPDTT
ncbi:MAG: flagellar biosynthesis anti-sigma factor FlgM [Ktedonobacteraceae bacterium]|nr:flagellar biosynthesis anti-sigma factor FlgM [Ktedonobacteraceae bacterium]